MTDDVQVALVTGGGSGIGKALCIALSKVPTIQTIVVVDIDYSSALSVANYLSNSLTSTCALQVDCGNEREIRSCIEFVWSKYGPIDWIFSNAGVLSMGGCVDDDCASSSIWESSWKVNVMQHVYIAKVWIPLWKRHNESFRKSRKFRLIVTASAAGLVTQVGSLPYSVTKHAAVAVAEWLSITYRDLGLVVHCVCPQFVNTNMMAIAKRELNRIKQRVHASKSNAVPTTHALSNKQKRRIGAGFESIAKVLSSEEVAAEIVESVQSGNKFLILPHKTVAMYWTRKVQNYDRWLKGMNLLNHALMTPSSSSSDTSPAVATTTGTTDSDVPSRICRRNGDTDSTRMLHSKL